MELTSTLKLCAAARAAAPRVAALAPEVIDRALVAMADALVAATDTILAANAEDVEAARGSISGVMIDRLMLTEARIAAMAEGIREISRLPGVLGQELERTVRPNGLVIRKVSVPIGVIAIIYESRPNVTSDAAALALKSGNACVLRSGKEAYRTSRAIVDAMRGALAALGIPEDAVNLVSDTTRTSSYELMRANGYVDMLIPRGGAGLIRACVENASVPCLETGTGICHVYVDAAADIDRALAIINNAKTSRPSVCNAAEVLLVHRDIAAELLPRVEKMLVSDRVAEGKVPVELRLCKRAAEYIHGTPAADVDFDTEFLDYILAVRIVDSVEAAVEHIAAHSTHHSEAIITEDAAAADYFTRMTDSAAVYVNASTRFTDGGEFGLGCEMGISTQKLHARGPLGIRELTTYKYIITGNGQIR